MTAVEDVLRPLAPAVLGAVLRRYGDFAACEDAVQEALLAAATRWPRAGLPDDPQAWLITVASRRRIEMLRSDAARRRREESLAVLAPPGPTREADDTLALLLLCCHPALTAPSRVALTLRAVGGLTTAEIARAYLVPEPTIAQRISRAKARIRGEPFGAPGPDRVAAVRQVLYLIFNEGYAASAGPGLTRVDLSTEAIRLARELHRRTPADGETAGLLALMLLTDARRAARTTADGALVPLAEQDRTRWDQAAVAEGRALLTDALTAAAPGPYQLQAAIAAVHDEAGRPQDTDWAQILVLYDLLTVVAPGPMVALNRAVAVAMVHGPVAGLAAVAETGLDHHRTDAVRAHLLELAGDTAAARDCYARAAARTRNDAERRYLLSRLT